jgi:hypothetical protein
VNGSQAFDADSGQRVGMTVSVKQTEGGSESNNASYTAPAKNIVVSKGAAGGNGTYCTGPGCATINVSISGFKAGSYTLWYSTDCNTGNADTNRTCLGGSNAGAEHYQSETIHIPASGSLTVSSRKFGYVGALVWVDINGHESNRYRW